MSNFEFYTPTHVYFGRDTQRQVGDLVRAQGCKKVLVHFGGQSARRSGLLDQIEASLDAAGVAHVQLGGVVPNPHLSLVYQGIDLCKKEGVDFILAVGGGSVIDSAKAIALGAAYTGDFWDFFDGKAIPTTVLPVASVLTIAAAGSEVSPVTVITREDGMLKRHYSSERIRPVFAVMNPELTITVPPYQTASGATDMMAHVIERYFTNTTGVELTDRLCEAVMLTIRTEVPRVLKDPGNYDARANLMWAGAIAHNDICGVGREQDWASHALEHELSGLYDCAHGAGLAVILPAWMEYVMQHDIARFAQFAVRVWGCDMNFAHPETTARAGIDAFRAFLRQIGMPTSFTDIRAREEDIPTLIDKLHLGHNTLGAFVKLDRNDCENIYRLACRQTTAP